MTGTPGVHSWVFCHPNFLHAMACKERHTRHIHRPHHNHQSSTLKVAPLLCGKENWPSPFQFYDEINTKILLTCPAQIHAECSCAQNKPEPQGSVQSPTARGDSGGLQRSSRGVAEQLEAAPSGGMGYNHCSRWRDVLLASPFMEGLLDPSGASVGGKE